MKCGILADTGLRQHLKQRLAPSNQHKKSQPEGWLSRTRCERSVLRLVDQLVLGDPRHHRTQLGTDLLDLVLFGQAAARDQRRLAGLVLQQEALGVFAGLDVLQALLCLLYTSPSPRDRG